MDLTALAPDAGRSRGFLFAVVATALTFYALAYFAPFSEADAALFLLLVALTGQRIRPYLLLLAATVQDAPGLSYLWSYIGFVGVASLLVAEYVLRRSTDTAAGASSRAERLVLIALLVAVYGTGVSALQSLLGGYPQSGDRPYLFVGGLMIAMVLSGYVASAVLRSHPSDRGTLKAVALLALGHALLIGLLQIPFGQAFYRSGGNLAAVELSRQLVEDTAIGFARINGPFLSPNAYGYTILLLALLAVLSSWKDSRWQASLIFVVAGGAAVMLSMSKALLGYYVLSCAVLIGFAAGPVVVAVLGVLALTVTFLVIPADLLDLAFAVFRVQDTLGSRGWAWQAVIHSLTATDWFFGIGLSAWPAFFDRYVGVPLSDPHSLPLSVAGTFGFVGVLFYALLVGTLLAQFNRNADATRRLGICLLLILFLVKDLVSIPAVLGNTPLTFMIWLLLGMTLSRGTVTSSKARRHVGAGPFAESLSIAGP